MPTDLRTPPSSLRHGGIPIAVVSAAAYGTAGTFAHPLLDAGWSSAAVTLLRLGGAGLVLLVPAILAFRRWHPTPRAMLRLVAYGVTATGGAQLCYFNAIRYVPVGTASLLEFTAPIWLLGWFWLRHRRPPTRALVISATLAFVGLVLVLDPGHAGYGSHTLPGLAWGLGSAFCLCAYFLLSDDHAAAAPATLTAGAGMIIGAVLVGAVGALGILPMRTASDPVQLGAAELPWPIDAAAVILVPTVFAYSAGIVAVRRLSSGPASFVALAEVVFAALFAALVLGQLPSPLQAAGMLLVIIGIVIAQRSPTQAPVLSATITAGPGTERSSPESPGG